MATKAWLRWLKVSTVMMTSKNFRKRSQTSRRHDGYPPYLNYLSALSTLEFVGQFYLLNRSYHQVELKFQSYNVFTNDQLANFAEATFLATFRLIWLTFEMHILQRKVTYKMELSGTATFKKSTLK
jgi:hypothetical protein